MHCPRLFRRTSFHGVNQWERSKTYRTLYSPYLAIASLKNSVFDRIISRLGGGLDKKWTQSDKVTTWNHITYAYSSFEKLLQPIGEKSSKLSAASDVFSWKLIHARVTLIMDGFVHEKVHRWIQAGKHSRENNGSVKLACPRILFRDKRQSARR